MTIVYYTITILHYDDTTTYLLTNDTTTYPEVPDLPVRILYPQTASVVMLPLELPSYAPRILVVGGSSVDFAGPSTPATNATYLLDFSVRPLIWSREDMTTGRVMPDTVLLPDGARLPGTPDVYQPQCLFAFTVCRNIGLLAVTAKVMRNYNPASWCTLARHS